MAPARARIRTVRNARTALVSVLVSVLLSFAAVFAVAGQPASAITTTTPDKGTWQVNGLVRATLETPTAIYLGGSFTELLGPKGQTVPRANFAALDRVTGAPLPVSANTDRPVWALAASADGSEIYLGGDFHKVAGKNRHRAAAVDATTGALEPFDPNLDARVHTIAVNATSVFLGGDFSTVGGAAHSRLAAVNPTSGALETAFPTTADGQVATLGLSADGSRLFVGGYFASVSSTPSTSYLASVDPTTGAVTTFPSRPNAPVRALAANATQLAVGIGGLVNAVAVYEGSSLARQWSASTDGDIQALAFQGDVLYVGGHFTEYAGQVGTGHLVAVSAADGSLLSWKVKPNSSLGVFSLTSYDGTLSVGGSFTKINFIARQHYARFAEI